jgi:ketosteroid isomerase-like protein
MGKDQEVRAAMRDLARALIERDVDVVARQLDDDFTGCDAAGVIVSRAQWLEDLANGQLVFQSIDAGPVETEAFDDAVRVRAELTFRARYTRSNYNGTFRCLGMYVRRGDGWKLLVSRAQAVSSRA